MSYRKIPLNCKFTFFFLYNLQKKVYFFGFPAFIIRNENNEKYEEYGKSSEESEWRICEEC